MNNDFFSRQLNSIKIAAIELLTIAVSFFAPSIYVALLVALFVFVDTYTGLKKARKLGTPRTTNRFSDMFAKLIGYAVFICVGLLLDKIFDMSIFVWISAIIPIRTEINSIDENQRAIGKKGINKEIEEAYQFALKIKKKRDELR